MGPFSFWGSVRGLTGYVEMSIVIGYTGVFHVEAIDPQVGQQPWIPPSRGGREADERERGRPGHLSPEWASAHHRARIARASCVHEGRPRARDPQVEAPGRSSRETHGQGSVVKAPSEGDLIEIDDIAVAGHEQKGRR